MILNLYAGIGGNRHLWPVDGVVAVEHDEKIAAEYKRRFPADEVVVGDAHQFLADNFARFDFIWASPPCPTHSRFWGQNRTPEYPDMKLYQEILFLQRWAPGAWVVENVKPYYKPLIEPAGDIGRHLFWSNLPMWGVHEPPPAPRGWMGNDGPNNQASRDELAAWLGIEPVNLCCNGNHDPGQAMRNCVHPATGLEIWNLYKANTVITKIDK